MAGPEERTKGVRAIERIGMRFVARPPMNATSEAKVETGEPSTRKRRKMKLRTEGRGRLKVGPRRGRVPNEGTSQGEFRGSVLSLMDLEIPSKRLLTREEERSLGQKIQSGFRRLKVLLPETLSGYRHYLQQMAEVHSGSMVS